MTNSTDKKYDQSNRNTENDQQSSKTEIMVNSTVKLKCRTNSKEKTIKRTNYSQLNNKTNKLYSSQLNNKTNKF